jgi:hypothetical protein
MNDSPTDRPAQDVSSTGVESGVSLVIYACSQGFFIAPIGDDRTANALRRRASPFYNSKARAEEALAERRAIDASPSRPSVE